MALFTTVENPMDKTIKIFDAFYNNSLIVNSNEFDIIRSYFIGVCSTKEIANNYTSIIFRIAQESGNNALDLLENVKGTTTTIELTRFFAYYLNSFKSKTSLYGIAEIPQPNQSIARNVVL